MQKILIISYFFPPANFVGVKRVEYWAKNLHKYGFYPIIITRCWNTNQKDIVGKVIDNNYKFEKNNTHEIHRVPIKFRLRDRCAYVKILKPLQKFLTFLEVLFSNFTLNALPYSEIYNVSKEVILNNKDLKLVIASGRPFQSFFIGHKLKKEFNHIKWIPDYRDEWNTHQNVNHRGLYSFFFKRLEIKSEKKWTNNSDFFISVSDYWVERISQFIDIKGYKVMNGFEKGIITFTNTFSSTLTIVYAGTLYSSQKVEYLVNACINAIDNGIDYFKVYFIGTEMNPTENQKLKKLTKKYKNNFFILDRMTQEELNKFYSKADLLYLTSFENIKGWYPVKLFDYFIQEKPVLLCPSDKDVMEEFIYKTNCGYIAQNTKECYDTIIRLIEKKQNKEDFSLKRNYKEAMKYSREFQTKLLADLLIKYKT